MEMKQWKHTWITIEFTLEEVIWEGTELFHSTNCNIFLVDPATFFIKLIINLQRSTDTYITSNDHFLCIIS